MKSLFTQLFLAFTLASSACFGVSASAKETVIVSEKAVEPSINEYHLFLKSPPAQGQPFMQWWEANRIDVLESHKLLTQAEQNSFFYYEINFFDVDNPKQILATYALDSWGIENLDFHKKSYFRNDRGEYMDVTLLESNYYLATMFEYGLGIRPSAAYADHFYRLVCGETNYKDSCDRIQNRSEVVSYYAIHKRTDRYPDTIVLREVPRYQTIIERWWLENESYFFEEYGVPTYADDGSYMIDVRQATHFEDRGYHYDDPARWGAHKQICYDDVDFAGNCLDKKKSLVMTIIKNPDGVMEFKRSKHYDFDRPSELK